MNKLNVILLLLLFGTFGCAGKTSEELYADGVQLLQDGKSDSAIVLFKNALMKNQSFLNARYQLARAYMSEEKYELAEKEFQKVKLMNPYQPEIKLDLAKLYNRLGKPDQAIRNVQEYLLDKTNSTDALEVIGRAYLSKKMHHEAEIFFLRALQIEPEKPTAKLELAALLRAKVKVATEVAAREER